MKYVKIQCSAMLTMKNELYPSVRIIPVTDESEHVESAREILVDKDLFTTSLVVKIENPADLKAARLAERDNYEGMLSSLDADSIEKIKAHLIDTV